MRRYGSLEAALAQGNFAAQPEQLLLYRSIATMDASAPFPPPRLNAGCGFRKETIAEIRRNGRDAP